jgi:hypothetical protein
VSWFRKKAEVKQQQMVCLVCKHWFAPHTDPLAKEHFGDLCLEHCKEKLDNMKRAIIVRDWALENWEKLEPRMLREKKARENKIKKANKGKSSFHQCSPLTALSQQGAFYQAYNLAPRGGGGFFS